MNIFLAFFQSEASYPIPAYDFWPYYLKNGIEEAGHIWSECPGADWARGLLPDTPQNFKQWKQDTWEKTVTWLKKNPADLCLTYLYPHMVDPGAIREIKKAGIPCVNFYCDHLRDFRKLPEVFCPFDLNWVPEYKAARLYRDAGQPFIHLPMPMWVKPEFRILSDEKQMQVTFIGSRDIQRQVLFEQVVQADPTIPLAIYGRGWEGQARLKGDETVVQPFRVKYKNQIDFIARHGLLPYVRKFSHRRNEASPGPEIEARNGGVPDFGQYISLTAGSAVTVGVNRFPSYNFPFSRPDSYSRLRDIEAPMLGACYLTEWTDGLGELYEPGKEIETFCNANEFVVKAKMLMDDPEKRKNLRYHGQKRALATHSIAVSLGKIRSQLSGKRANEM